jgi:hypothetical protein
MMIHFFLDTKFWLWKLLHKLSNTIVLPNKELKFSLLGWKASRR